MEKSNNSKTVPAFTINRTFNAPAALVFQALTEAEHFKQWWGPKGATIDHYEVDLRKDGIGHYCMKFGNGREMWGVFIFQEISPNDKLVFINSTADKDGNYPISFPNMPYPNELLNTIKLKEENGKTHLTLSVTPINATDEQLQAFEKMKDGAKGGWEGAFDKLVDYIEKM